MKPTFYIIKFLEENTVEIVPSNWIVANNSKCHWPSNLEDTKIINLVQKCVDPLEYPKVEWTLHDCTIKCGTDSYEKASSALDKPVENSDIELTEAEDANTPGRKLRRRKPKKVTEKTDGSSSVTTAGLNNPPIGNEKNRNLGIATSTASAVTIPFEFNCNLDNIFDQACPRVSPTERIAPEDSQRNFSIEEGASYIDLSSACFNQPPETNSVLNEILSSVTHLAVDHKNFQQLVIRQLANITTDIAEVVRISSKNTTIQPIEVFEIPGIGFPVNTAEDFRALHQWLASTENKAKFVKYLKGIGGEDLETFVKRILSRIIGGDLANQSNFTGVKNKIKVKGHALLDCILAAVRKRPEDTTPTEFECHSIVGKWFLGSGDRNGGRAERQKKKIQAENNNKNLN